MEYMTFLLKRMLAPLLLLSFLTVVFFGFAAMSRGSDGNMQGGCPFSLTSASLCPQDALAVALHHLSSYGSFISVPAGSMVLVLLELLLLISLIALVPTIIRSLALHPPQQRGNAYRAPPVSSRRGSITRWLSLLENSPSLS